MDKLVRCFLVLLGIIFSFNAADYRWSNTLSFSIESALASDGCTVLPTGIIWCPNDPTPLPEDGCTVLPSGVISCPTTPARTSTPTRTPTPASTSISDPALAPPPDDNCWPDFHECDTSKPCCNSTNFTCRLSQGNGQVLSCQPKCSRSSGDDCEFAPCCTGTDLECDKSIKKCIYPCIGGIPNFRHPCSGIFGQEKECCGGLRCGHDYKPASRASAICCSTYEGHCNGDPDCCDYAVCSNNKCNHCYEETVNCAENPDKCCHDLVCDLETKKCTKKVTPTPSPSPKPCEQACTNNSNCNPANEKCCLEGSGLPESLCKTTGPGNNKNCCVKWVLYPDGCCNGTETAATHPLDCDNGVNCNCNGCCEGTENNTCVKDIKDCPQDWDNVPNGCVPNQEAPTPTVTSTPNGITNCPLLCEQLNACHTTIGVGGGQICPCGACQNSNQTCNLTTHTCTNIGCIFDYECSLGESCVNGRCQQNGACPTGERCSRSSPVCCTGGGGDPTCRRNSDCNDGWECQAGSVGNSTSSSWKCSEEFPWAL